MHAGNFDLFPGSGYSVEWAALSYCDCLRESHIVLVRYKMFNRDLEVGKRRMKMRELMDKAFRSGTPVVRRIVVLYAKGKNLV